MPKNSPIKSAKLVALFISPISGDLVGMFECGFGAGNTAVVEVASANTYNSATITDCKDRTGTFTEEAHRACFAAWESQGSTLNPLTEALRKIEKTLKASGISVGTMDYATGKVV